MKKFFVICPVGFEEGVAYEIRDCWSFLIGKDGKTHAAPLPEFQIYKGGVEFVTEEFLAFQLNFFLKTATRILMRLAEFKARDFPKLHDKIRSLPWLEYYSSSNLEYVVAASQSRLNHEGRIEDTVIKTLKPLLKESSKDPQGKIYIRIEEDLCTVSLDTTGEHLHKRGWATLKSAAPLRENIAAFVLKTLMEDQSIDDLKKLTLMDPMMGSGTFLLEARSMMNPQWDRPFYFQKFKSCPKIFLSPAFPANYKLPNSLLFKAFIGSDHDKKAVDIAEKNWLSLEKEISRVEKKHFVPGDVTFRVADIFAGYLGDKKAAAQTLWIVSNPPYGERLKDPVQGDLAKYFEIFAVSEAAQIALLYPEGQGLKKSDCPSGYKIKAQIPIVNGGLKTILTVIQRLS